MQPQGMLNRTLIQEFSTNYSRTTHFYFCSNFCEMFLSIPFNFSWLFQHIYVALIQSNNPMKFLFEFMIIENNFQKTTKEKNITTLES